MAGAAVLAIKIVTDARDAQKGLDNTAKSAGKMKRGLSTASKVSAGVLGLVAVAAIDAGKAAAEDEQSQAILAQTMRKSAGATAKQVAATEDWISSMAAATGVADDELRPALGDLMRATGDTAKAQDALKVAMDVSAATGKPLGTVSKAIAKGFGGSATSLGKLVPGLDKAALKAGDMTAIMAQLADKTGGAAATAADTAAGKMKRAQVAMDEAKEAAGSALLPVMAKLATVLATVAAFAQKHSGAMQALAVVLAVVAAAIIVLNAAVSVYTAVTTIAGAVSGAAWLAALWPILAVIAAVLVVAGVFVLLWKRSQTFRSIVLGVWSAVRTAAAAVARTVTAAWKLVWNALAAVARAFGNTVKSVFTAISGAARTVGSAIGSVWRTVWAAASKIAGQIKSAWAGVWSSLKGAARSAASVLTAPFEAMQRAIDKVISTVRNLIDKISHIKLPNIPGIGSLMGGKAAPGVSAAPGVRVAGVGAAVPVSGGAGIVVNVYGVLDGTDAARKIRGVLRVDDRRRSGVRVVGR